MYRQFNDTQSLALKGFNDILEMGQHEAHYYSPKTYNKGATHQAAKYPDSVVRDCRNLKEIERMTYHQISKKKNIPWTTVRSWCEYEMRLNA